MIFSHRGKIPCIRTSTRVAPNATICGDVTIGENCSIGFGCVLTAESGPIVIGDNCVVMDTAVLRGIGNAPLTIGNNVMIGPRACLSGCKIEDEAFIATGATVFNGATVGRRAQVRINGLVHLRTTLEAGAVVPLGWIAVGDPAEILPPHEHERIWAIQKELNFPEFVFGISRPERGQSIMPDIMYRYARSLNSHNSDEDITSPT